MKVIPVIDIKSGQAVLAKQGHRQNYHALSTPLCSSSEPAHVIQAYLGIWDFKKIYLADLDSLMGIGDNSACINSLFSKFPHLNFMVDCGKIDPNYFPASSTQYTAILGTESFSPETLKEYKKNFILSLDFSAEDLPLGNTILYNSSSLWPKELIIMSLARVGNNQGADLQKIINYQQQYPQHHFIAAGGIRDLNDLQQLKKANIQQALVASALHTKQLQSSDLAQIL